MQTDPPTSRSAKRNCSDDSSGTQGDDSKNSYDLSTSGTPAWDASGKNNGCMQFVDSSDTISEATLLDSTDFSVCGWFKCDTVLSSGNTVYPWLVDDTSSGGYDSGIAFVHDGSAGTNYNAHAYWEGVDQGDMLFGTFDLSNWTFFAMTFDVDGYGLLTVNGSSRKAMNAVAGLNHTGSQTWRSQPAQDGYTMICEVDEIYIQKGVLWDSNTLTALYNSGAGKFVDSNGNF
jgi:hypothetical protein